MSHGVGADCDSAGMPVNEPDSAEVTAEGEEGVLGLKELFAGYLSRVEHLGGGHPR